MKRLLIIATAFLIGILAMNSCVKEYTITVTSNNSEWGTVAGTGTYLANSEIVITAIPAAGYYFIKWDDENTDNPRTVIVNGDKTYQAIFSNNPNGGGQGGGSGTAVNFSGNIDENTTWPDLGLPIDYIVDGWIYVNGNSLLTIEPGVTIMFTGVNGGMTIGENAGLRMVGTADKPIKFVGPTNNVNNGSWDRIQISSKRTDNVWEYVEFIRGGTSDYEWSAVVDVQGAKLSMRNCTIDGSLGCGMDLDYEAKLIAFEGNTIKNCAKYPIISGDWCSLFDLTANNTFSNNTKNFVAAYCSGIDLTENTTIKKLPIPYYIDYGISVSGGYKLTIEAGTEFYVNSEKEIRIAEESALIANGTAAEPIVFRGMENEIGYWRGIRYHSQKESSIMNYCKIGNCGENEAGFWSACLSFWNGSRLTLTNCTFGNCRHYGIALDDIENMNSITHSGNTFTGCNAGNVFVETGGTYNGVDYENEQILDNLPE